MHIPDKCPACGGLVQKMGSSSFKIDPSKLDAFCTLNQCFYLHKAANQISWDLVDNYEIYVHLDSGLCDIFNKKNRESEPDDWFVVTKEGLNDIEKMHKEVTLSDFVTKNNGFTPNVLSFPSLDS